MDSAPNRQATGGHGRSVAVAFPARWREAARPEWLADWAPRPFAVEGGEVEGVELGGGPPLVMLPPLPGWKEAFVACAPLLARRFRVISFDLRSRFEPLPGAAAGRGARRAAEWGRLVADAHAIAAARSPAPVAVLGHSLGAALALRWAIAHPAQVRALVLSSGFARVFTPPGAWWRRWVEQPMALAGMRLLTDGGSRRWARALAARRAWVFDGRSDRAVVELTRIGVRAAPLALLGARVALALAHDVRASLAAVRCPTLILAGEQDTPFALGAAEELARLLPQATRRTVSAAGHLHPLSSPDEFARHVIEWLDRLPAASP